MFDRLQAVEISDQELREGDEVWSIGFGFFKRLRRASVYRGNVSKVVEDDGRQLFVQHTARTYPGQSGGALLTKSTAGKWQLRGLIFKNSLIKNEKAGISKQFPQMSTAISSHQFSDLLKMAETGTDLQTLPLFNK